MGALCLIKIKSSKGSRTHLVEKETFTIGRSQDADIPTLSPSTSRVHLAVKIMANEVLVVDQGSANGTIVNGQPLPPNRPVSLNSSAVVKLGTAEEEFRFEVVENPIEKMNLEDQRAILKTQLQDLQKHFEEQALREAKAECDKIVQTGSEEIAQKKKAAADEIDKKKAAANEEITKLLQNANTDARNTTDAARKEAEVIKVQMTERAINRRKEIEAENNRLEIEMQSMLSQLKMDSQREVEEMIKTGRAKALQIEEEALEKAQVTIKDSQHKAVELLKQADLQSEELVKQARADVVRIRTEATGEAHTIKDQAFKQGDQRIAEAREEAKTLLANVKEQVAAAIAQQTHDHTEELKAEKAAAHKEIEGQRQRMFDKAQEDAQAELEKIMKTHRKEIVELESQVKALSHQRSDEEKAIKILMVEKTETKTQVDLINSQMKKLQHELPALQKEKEDAKALIAQLEDSDKRLKEADLERQKALAEAERYQREVREGRSKIEAEFKNFKEKSLIEFEAHKKALTEELATTRLKSMEELKKAIAVEERKFQEIKRNQAAETARSVELKILPKFKSMLKGEDAANKVAELRQDLYNVITEVLAKGDTSFTSQTGHLTGDAEAKEKARNKKIQWGSIAAAALVAIIIYWKRTELMNVIENSDKNGYATQMLEERKRQSLYNPEMDDKFRKTYTDNVLYMRGYHETKIRQEYINFWTLELNNLELLRSMDLGEEDIIQYISKESTLVNRLGELKEQIDAVYLDQGLQRMRQAEEETLAEIKKILKKDRNFARIKKMEERSLAQFTERQLRKAENHEK